MPFALIVRTANDELDATPNAADLSFREAIALANGGLGADTITFAAALAGQPILLRLGQMTISDAVTIQGLGAAQTIVMGSNDPQLYSRLFDITDTAGDVTFDSLTLTGGKTTASGESGGAVRSKSAGQLTIQNNTISGNSTAALGGFGGGIYSQGAVFVVNSTISGNAASLASGGGIFSSASVTVSSSTISGNTSGSSTIPGALSRGGGIYAVALTVTNSTISDNATLGQRGYGGGIFSHDGSVTITNSTITGNSIAGSDADGGGLYSLNSTVTIRNSIVAGNQDANQSHPDLRSSGTLTVQFSLIGDNNGNLGLTNGTSGNLVGTHAIPLDPQLGPLQNNGGPTPTHALIATSPALDAGDTGFVAPPSNDQRGVAFARVADGPDADATPRLDMGAFEFQTLSIPSTLVVDTAIDEGDGNYTAGDLSLRDAVALANARSGAHTITFAAALAGQPIVLTLGQITISDPLTLRGLATGQITVMGSNDPLLYSRLFDITASAADVTFDRLTLTGGKTTNSGRGGAILSASAQLTIHNSTISGNSTTGPLLAGGGGIYTSGAVKVTNSTISGNSAMGSGGGIDARTVTLTNSTVTGNSANGGGSGGGIYSYFGYVTIHNSIVAGNLAIRMAATPTCGRKTAPLSPDTA